MKIIQSKSGAQVLADDNGNLKNCPFQPVQFLPGKLAGQIAEHHKPCGNWCPHFQFIENGAKKLVEFTCTGKTLNWGIKEVITQKTDLQNLKTS